MRTICFVLILVFAYLPSAAQSIKKIKIEELEAYIQKSDHPLVISFWATWCAPCVKEIPWLQAAIEKYKEKRPELILVSLDFAEAYPQKITAFANRMNFKATLFWLNETNADHFCPPIDVNWQGGIPANLFVNPNNSYRKFIDRQLTELQAEQEVRLLVQ